MRKFITQKRKVLALSFCLVMGLTVMIQTTSKAVEYSGDQCEMKSGDPIPGPGGYSASPEVEESCTDCTMTESSRTTNSKGEVTSITYSVASNTHKAKGHNCQVAYPGNTCAPKHFAGGVGPGGACPQSVTKTFGTSTGGSSNTGTGH